MEKEGEHQRGVEPKGGQAVQRGLKFEMTILWRQLFFLGRDRAAHNVWRRKFSSKD